MALMDRRAFIARGIAATGGGALSAVALERLAARAALADKGRHGRSSYGEPQPVPDQRGIEVLALPAGFSYVTFGHIASQMSDGHLTPLALDGMAAFRGPARHGAADPQPRGPQPAGARAACRTTADAYDQTAGGGTSTLDYDPHTRTLVRDYISLSGSHVNCAGGFGLHRKSWLTGEETVFGPELQRLRTKRHGYVFEVPLHRGPRRQRRPAAEGDGALHARGARHRRAQRDRLRDRGPRLGPRRGLLPLPARATATTSRKGGRLQILGIKGSPQYDAREGQRRGRPLPVKWIDIPDPDPEYLSEDDPRGVFRQGWDAGACKFNRLEGCWADGDSIYFVSTSGGDAKNGDETPFLASAAGGDGVRCCPRPPSSPRAG